MAILCFTGPPHFLSTYSPLLTRILLRSQYPPLITSHAVRNAACQVVGASLGLPYSLLAYVACRPPKKSSYASRRIPMYRQSIPGLALAAALAEIQPALTARQEEEIWSVFDAAMQAAVADAPLMSRISVHTPPPASADGGGYVAVTPVASELYVPADAEEGCGADGAEGIGGKSSSASQSYGALLDDSDIAFPVYRLVDDEWTLLLKDPTVEVRNELGVSEKIQLDYLRVRLKDIGARSGATQAKQSRALLKRRT
ncbi:hypothetical protein LSCM1_00042 [Leishmania martiniquensis]|uniref:Uncharacterized protein n=1 Tax=Leishmania martiniquensis TaxID=1580590 RepID=A0A836G216_9TRYP|nr:hypothetical protein LSCM1_00042 [Leishmania martiniquensis]